MCPDGSNPDLSRNDRWERGDSMSIISNLPQTGSLERHRILSESLPPQCYFSADCLCSKSDFRIITALKFLFAGSSKMDSPILSHDSRHKPGESRTSSRPGRPAVSGSFKQTLYWLCLQFPTYKTSFKITEGVHEHITFLSYNKL